MNYDFCIIETGMAGSTLAIKLAKSNYSILIIDAGSFSIKNKNISFKNVGRDFKLRATRSIQLGGTNNLWHGVLSPLDNMDFEKRSWMPHSGWSITKKDNVSYTICNLTKSSVLSNFTKKINVIVHLAYDNHNPKNNLPILKNILQPTIVYGENGNWSNHTIKELKTKYLILPNQGKNLCNAVDVYTVCNAIKNAINNAKNIKSGSRFLISDTPHISWKAFYLKHNVSNENIKFSTLKFKFRFENNFIKNSIYTLLFSKIGTKISLRLWSYLKRNPKYNNTPNHSFTPVCINRVVHNFAFNVSTENAKNNNLI